MSIEEIVLCIFALKSYLALKVKQHKNELILTAVNEYSYIIAKKIFEDNNYQGGIMK